MRTEPVETKSTIDLLVEEGCDLTRYRRAMYSLRSVVFSHTGLSYSGKVVSVRPHSPGGSAWTVTLVAKPYVAKPLKRARLRWVRRADGEYVVH